MWPWADDSHWSLFTSYLRKGPAKAWHLGCQWGSAMRALAHVPDVLVVFFLPPIDITASLYEKPTTAQNIQ